MPNSSYAPSECLTPDSTKPQQVDATSADQAITTYYNEHGKKDGGFFWRNIVEKVINQTGCIGIRYYHGKVNSEPMIVFSGVEADPVTKNHKAMIPDGTNGYVLAGNPVRISEAAESQQPEEVNHDTSSELNVTATGKKDHTRPRDPHAKSLIAKFRKEHSNEKHGGFFWKDTIDKVLAQPDCIGIRYYFGKTKSGENEMVIYGVNSSFIDIKS